jgi:hypothetical protein
MAKQKNKPTSQIVLRCVVVGTDWGFRGRTPYQECRLQDLKSARVFESVPCDGMDLNLNDMVNITITKP